MADSGILVITLKLVLQYVRDNSFLSANGGGRPDVQKLVILLTDGENNAGLEVPEQEANKLKQDGVTVVAIGVGTKFVLAELQRIASQNEYVFTSDSFEQLNTLLDKIVNIACEGKQLQTSKLIDIHFVRLPSVVFVFFTFFFKF